MPTQAVSQIILSLLEGDRQYKPLELLEALREKGLEEAEIKEAVAYLINDHQVEMTSDRRLKTLSAAAMHA